jgi:hypothetical protein
MFVVARRGVVARQPPTTSRRAKEKEEDGDGPVKRKQVANKQM